MSAYDTPPKDRSAAGILAILLGNIGIHKFYLGATNQGLLYLIFCWTFIPGILGLIEGVLYLTMSDEEFAEKQRWNILELIQGSGPHPSLAQPMHTATHSGASTMQYQPKNPALAAILSFLINGLGQIYNGEIGKGILIILLQIVNVALMTVAIGFITAPIVFIWSIYDAYKVAERINAESGQQIVADTKVCPQCAERVNSGAQVCRFCGYQFMPAQAALPAAVSTQSLLDSTPVPAPQPAAAKSKFCPDCGNQTNASAKFCMSCGHRFEGDVQAETAEIGDEASA